MTSDPPNVRPALRILAQRMRGALQAVWLRSPDNEWELHLAVPKAARERARPLFNNALLFTGVRASFPKTFHNAPNPLVSSVAAFFGQPGGNLHLGAGSQITLHGTSIRDARVAWPEPPP